jgi:hypothetical protein
MKPQEGVEPRLEIVEIWIKLMKELGAINQQRKNRKVDNPQ